MADPFEVRMRFTNQLQHLNASVNSAQKAASYAIKNRDMDEDLHSCILEQLERNNMNNRANIFYFIEHLCEQAQREGHLSYVNNIRRDIFRIVDAVAPSDGTGAANVKVVRKGLPKLEQLSVLTSSTAAELDAALKERDTATHTAMVSPWTAAAEASSAAKDPGGAAAPTTTSKGNGFGKLDKRQIEQRIEEDRERHKRLKESLWSVSGDGYEEADKLWDEASDFGEDDILQAQEETAELMEITVDELEKKEGKFDFGTVRRI